MPTADEIIAEARSWEHTPHIHQQAVKGPRGGIDCVNFIAEIAKRTGAVPDAEFEKNYRRESSGEVLIGLLREYKLRPVETTEARKADILVLTEGRGEARRWHVILLTETEPYWRGIHSSRRGVREHRLDNAFKQQIHSAWRLTSLDV